MEAELFFFFQVSLGFRQLLWGCITVLVVDMCHTESERETHVSTSCVLVVLCGFQLCVEEHASRA